MNNPRLAPRKLWLLAASAACLLQITPPAGAASKIRLAQPTIAVMFAPLYFGAKQGVFTGEGFELEFMTMRTDLAIAALGAGEVDLPPGGGPAVPAPAQAFRVKLVFPLNHKTRFGPTARPESKTVHQRKKKKIGRSFPADTPHIILKRFLRQQGLDPDRDVTYVGGQFSPVALQSLLGGAIDAAVLAPPFNVLAEERGLRLLTFLGQSVRDVTVSNGIVTSEQKIKTRPDEVKRMVRASLKALDAYRRDKLAAVEFLSSYFEISPKTAAKVFPQALDILTQDGQISEAELRQILDMMQDTGQKESARIQPAGLMDFSFLRAARKEIGSAAASKKSSR